MNKLWYLPEPGTSLDAIPTPALLVDLDLMEKNLNEMAAFFADKPAGLRPHFKTHKCAELAKKQMELGATGLTCAKLGEAEVLVEAGIPSILIANQVVDPRKIERVADLARLTELIVAVDEENNLRQLAEAARRAGSEIQILLEINVGLNRCGLPPGEAGIELAKLAGSLPGVRMRGVLGYEGHTVFEKDLELRRENVQQSMGLLTGTAEIFRQSGCRVEIISAGGTGTYDLTGCFPGVTEVEAGSYVFMDSKYIEIGLPFAPALSLLATVISRPTPTRAVIDAGMKALTGENGLPLALHPGVRLIALHEEHGILEVEADLDLQVGARVRLLPSHVCTTVNLHERYYLARDGRYEGTWQIAGRGRVQ